MKKADNISQKIKQIRDRNNMSQKRFGIKVGLSGKTISAYENGKCVPSLKVLERISETYDVSFVQVKSEKRIVLIKQLDLLKKLVGNIEDLLKRRG